MKYFKNKNAPLSWPQEMAESDIFIFKIYILLLKKTSF